MIRRAPRINLSAARGLKRRGHVIILCGYAIIFYIFAARGYFLDLLSRFGIYFSS